ncbi:PhoH family protein [Selenihalanaerobacter shriftii]|uniref:PhoH-like ATPase n=1 Tax=Selenihalanaerobacter shriftii TaxID=142842 RepID=A0A1T4JKE1_9FIRM|nr:PhoH family protein [Selenihalanaerobacter shriftii]SJZ30660.1 PhoH-like ATPase [Selenihalanaerobacter shriftii]
MKKIYVLDTNVLLHDPTAIFAFDDNDVIIPIVVIEEIDSQKKRQDSIGRNAREVSRYLDKLRDEGRLYEGVNLKRGGSLKVELNHQVVDLLPLGLDKTKPDNRILSTAMGLNEDKDIEKPVILVTKDINMRVKSDALGIEAEDYETNKVDIEELYSGLSTLQIDPKLIDQFYTENELKLEQDFYPNEFVLLEDNVGGSQSALCRYDDKEGVIKPLIFQKPESWGIRPRNKEQQCAFDLLLNDKIKVITLVGKAGTGKTLLALAAGLEKVVEEKNFNRLLVTRPIVPMGNDLGYLPGNKEEKLRPWMQPIFDNMEFLVGGQREGEASDIIQDLQDMNLIEMEALTYIRGRSIPQQFIIVDEAQNLTPHEVKTIITRVGEGTKIILTGDPYQIDNPYLDSNSNGLTYLVERFKNEEIAGHITLNKGERSQLAELAASLL